MSAGCLTPTQRLYNPLNEAVDNEVRESAPSRAAWYAGRFTGLTDALKRLVEFDPDSDPGKHVPGRVYGAEQLEHDDA